jgi:hypothetical protein
MRLRNTEIYCMMNFSVAEPEPHHLTGARAITQCGSGFDGSGSKLHVHHRWIIKNVTKCNILFPFPILCNYFNHSKIKGRYTVDITLRLTLFVFKKLA